MTQWPADLRIGRLAEPGAITGGVAQPASCIMVVSGVFQPATRLRSVRICTAFDGATEMDVERLRRGPSKKSRSRMCGAPTPERADAAARGVVHAFHVSLAKVEPFEARHRLRSNLLSKDDCRAALLDEPVEAAGHQSAVSSANPAPLPAEAEGWQWTEPVQTGRSSGQPARRSAKLQTPMPAKKWHCVKPARSDGGRPRCFIVDDAVSDGVGGDEVAEATWAA